MKPGGWVVVAVGWRFQLTQLSDINTLANNLLVMTSCCEPATPSLIHY